MVTGISQKEVPITAQLASWRVLMQEELIIIRVYLILFLTEDLPAQTLIVTIDPLDRLLHIGKLIIYTTVERLASPTQNLMHSSKPAAIRNGLPDLISKLLAAINLPALAYVSNKASIFIN